MVQLLLHLELFFNFSEKNDAFQTGVVFSNDAGRKGKQNSVFDRKRRQFCASS